MLKNSEFIEEFKKSISATVKSIGKNEDLEINYVKENPSIVGNIINLTEPNIENIKNNLPYLRAEADSMALEFRLHSKEIHQYFIKNDELSNEIINALEQTRIEVKGSLEFKGIKKNLKFKHLKYSDHYNFKKSSIDKILSISRNKKIITTEKDYGRLKPKINRGEIYYLEVSIEFPNNLNKISFDEVVYDFVENY